MPVKESTQQQIDVLLEEEIDTGYRLILHNDEVNTFDWVIISLVEVCGHNHLQAKQIAYIVHFKGKCIVKEGSFDDLMPQKDALSERGLQVTIEKDQ
ncbi:MAG: ATP-dependent Clp protease adaptor ClpS [Chitinophagales bacterium]